MAKLTVNIGQSANDRTGDNLRTAFNKINTNFTELYTALGLDDASLNLGAFEFTGSVMTTTDSSAITIDQAVTVSSDLNVGGDVVPNTDLGSSLGSATKRWKDLYVGANTIHLGSTTLGVSSGGTLEVGGSSVSSTVDYNDIQNKPTIPTATSELTNDSGFLTSATTELSTDTTPELGGDLQTNDKNIYFGDSDEHDWGAGNADNTLMFGSTGDLRMWVPTLGSIAYVQTFNTHSLRLRGDNGIQLQVGGGYELLTLNTTGSVDIKYNGNTRMASATTGVNMTAGAFKLFNYADATARDAALTSPEAGMMVYITDTNKAQVYNGTSWIDLH